MNSIETLQIVGLPFTTVDSKEDTLQTEIDGCSVTMHFAAASNDTAMKQVQETLKGAYLRSISE